MQSPDLLPVSWLSRGRFVDLPGATVRQVQANAYEVRVPINQAIALVLRAEPTPSLFDDGTIAIGDRESMQVLANGRAGGYIVLTVLL